MSNILPDNISLKLWPFLEAQKILDHIGGKCPKKGYVLFETGYGPSGLPHIGTFSEVFRTTMVINAFQQISDIPIKLICFSDDMDGLRKVPTNIPNQDLIAKYIDFPLSKVPDPFEEQESFGDYMNSQMIKFLDHFNFQYEFYSASKTYKSGMFDNTLLTALDKYEDLMAIMIPTLGEERQKTYSPFMPICRETGKVLQVPIDQLDKRAGKITYKNQGGELVEVSVTGGNCKLQWKPDFAMRWAALSVDYEMYGKDHRPNAAIYSNLCKALNAEPPVQYFYEMFLGEDGSKISKSRGNGISIEEWLQYAPLESMALFMFQSPNKAKRLFFDVIPKNVDEYINFVDKYHAESDLEKRVNNPVYLIHNGEVPKLGLYGLSFNLLLNLASVCNPDNKEVLEGFIVKYAPGADHKKDKFLDSLSAYAVRYYNNFIKPNKKYIIPNAEQIDILNQMKDILSNLEVNTSSQDIQRQIYDIGMKSGYENLRDYFKDLYQILLGQEQGPRLGSFIKLYGIKSFIDLIDSKLDS